MLQIKAQHGRLGGHMAVSRQPTANHSDFQGANAVAVRRDETIAFSWVPIHNYFWPRGEDVRRSLAVFFVTTDSVDGADQVARRNLIRASGVIRG